MAAEAWGKWFRRSGKDWRALIAQYDREGGGVEEFCRRQGISAASFYRWRGLLGKPPGALPETPVDDGRAAFLDLGTIQRKNSAASAKPRIELKIDLGEGLVLHLVRP